ncbi:universal stress protein [Streptomyces sp. enrichment culture]|uniref:universal stress protein n=1 Tax=Streptomyces sp. enrichment culture TaxID=1795815 RepID=UPI003F55595F
MSRSVTVGLDGSRESLAAAEWAACEAELRELPLRLVNVWTPTPERVAQAPLLGPDTLRHWSERIPRDAAGALRRRHPRLEVSIEQLVGRPSETLAAASKECELLVLGSRGLSGIGGFLVGSVAQAVVARTEVPVVLVRAGQKADEPGTAAAKDRPVVLGLDADSPHDAVIGFAFETASRRSTALRVVHGWSLPLYYPYGLANDPDMTAELRRQDADAVAAVIDPWKEKFPQVEVTEESRGGSAAIHLVDASRDASLVVVGRRIRRNPFGIHIGSVTHAVLHHATAPVAVVAHD